MGKYDYGLNLGLFFSGSTIKVKTYRDKVSNHINKLERFDLRGKNLYPALQRAGQILGEVIEQNFETQGRPKKWTRLRPSTIKERQRAGYTPIKVLTRSGSLRKGFSFRITRRQLRVYNETTTRSGYSLALLHQHGWTHWKSRQRISPRPPVALTAGDERRIYRVIRDYIVYGF